MITGGLDSNGNTLTRVTSYNKDWDSNNYLGPLPNMLEARMLHGCTFYYNSLHQNGQTIIQLVCEQFVLLLMSNPGLSPSPCPNKTPNKTKSKKEKKEHP